MDLLLLLRWANFGVEPRHATPALPSFPLFSFQSYARSSNYIYILYTRHLFFSPFPGRQQQQHIFSWLRLSLSLSPSLKYNSPFVCDDSPQASSRHCQQISRAVAMSVESPDCFSFCFSLLLFHFVFFPFFLSFFLSLGGEREGRRSNIKAYPIHRLTTRASDRVILYGIARREFIFHPPSFFSAVQMYIRNKKMISGLDERAVIRRWANRSRCSPPTSAREQGQKCS